MTRFFKKLKKTHSGPFLASFSPFLGKKKTLLKNLALSRKTSHEFLTPSLEKTNDQFQENIYT